MREERWRGQANEEEEVSSYWITLKRQRRYCILKDEGTRPRSLENSLWKRLCTCRKTDLVGKEMNLMHLVRYSSYRVS
jgi:hypothetical protein